MKNIVAQFILLISFFVISQSIAAQGCSTNNPDNMVVDGNYYFKTQIAVTVFGTVSTTTWNISNVTGGDIYLLPSTTPQATPINLPEISSPSPYVYSLDFWILSGETITIEMTSPDFPGLTLSSTVGGCTALPPPTVIIETNELCPGDDLLLMETGTGGSQWEWTGPNGFSSDKRNPVISNPTAANTGDYTVTVINETGISTTETLHVEVSDPFSFDFDNAAQTTQTSTGMNVYAIEFCGGSVPYSIDLDETGGFASSNLLPSSNAGCQMLQITYANGVSWTATITDADDCSNESSTISSDDLGGTPLLMIDGFDVVKETGAGKLDGELTINVSGGDDSCDDYTYNWSGPNTNLSNTDSPTGNTLTGLASGTYSVTLTDCVGNTSVGSHYLPRESSRRRGRSKTTLDDSITASLQMFPNPAKNFVQVNYLTGQVEETTLSITDLAGRNLWTQIINQEEGQLNIPVSNLENGLYIVMIRANNELIGKEKLLIMR